MICATAGNPVLDAKAEEKPAETGPSGGVGRYFSLSTSRARGSTSLYVSASLHLRSVEIASKFGTRPTHWARARSEMKETTA